MAKNILQRFRDKKYNMITNNLKIGLTLILIMIGFIINAQNQRKIDSLLQTLKLINGDSLKVIILNELAYEIKDRDPLIAVKYSKNGLELSKINKFKRGEAISLKEMGGAYAVLGNFKAAIDCFFKSIEICQKINYKSGIAENYVGLGDACYNQKNFIEAKSYFKKSLQIGEEINDNTIIAFSLCNLGFVNHAINENKLALYYLQRNYSPRKNK